MRHQHVWASKEYNPAKNPRDQILTLFNESHQHRSPILIIWVANQKALFFIFFASVPVVTSINETKNTTEENLKFSNYNYIR